MTQEEAINTLQVADEAGQRRSAAEELVQSFAESAEINEALIKGLLDPDKGTRDACALGLLRDSEQFAMSKATRVAALISHERIEVRNLAGDILLKLGNAGAEALLPWLKDQNPDNQKFACDIIGLTGSDDVIEPVKALLESEDGNARAAAIEALGKLKAHSALQALIGLYETDEELRPHIIEAVGSIGGATAEQFLLKEIQSDDEFIQIASIDALAESAVHHTVADKLLTILPHASKEIQIILLKTIFSIAFRLELAFDLPQELRYIAHSALLDNDPDARIAGLLALGNMYQEEDVIPLISEVQKRDTETLNQILNVLLLSSPKSVIRRFFETLVSSRAFDADHFTEILGLLLEMWNQLPQEAKDPVEMILVESIGSLDQLHDEILDFLCAVAPGRSLTILRQDIESDDNHRKDNAVALVHRYSISELQPLIASLNRADAENDIE